jgi:secreted PhoX family phosphatase
MDAARARGRVRRPRRGYAERVQKRRDFLRSGLVGAGALALGPGFWNQAFAAVERGPSPYGSLGPPDANGLKLPAGFSSRVVAEGNHPMGPETTYVWHQFSDGAATYPTSDGGWILVSNSEVPFPGQGGASAIRFGPRSAIQDAYRILEGTHTNCAGGATPWGTWLSCEEIDDGRVWECDPRGEDEPLARPALGVFRHEAVCVDRRTGYLYLTEDLSDGGFYRFKPRQPGDLSSGVLQIAKVRADGSVDWVRVPEPRGGSTNPTRHQVPGSTEFARGEGIWFDSGTVYVATTADSTIHAYDTRSKRIRVLYRAADLPDPPLTDVDNITVSRSGDLFVCEDDGGGDPFDIGIITRRPNRRVARFLKVTNEGPGPGPGPYQHGEGGTEASSELAGVVFNPAGSRLYFSSQRANGAGVIFEVKGPFRR